VNKRVAPLSRLDRVAIRRHAERFGRARFGDEMAAQIAVS
jgi:hypothetical protein